MTMYAPLTQGDLFPTSDFSRTLSSEVLHARTSVAPTPKAKASKASGQGSSSKPSASSENAALVGSLLKTALISELGALTPSSLRWRQSATPAGRSWFVLETSGPITNARDAGSSGATSSRLGTPTSNPAPRGSVLRRVKGVETSAEDAFDRAPNAGEIVHFMLPTPTKTKYGSQSYPEDPSRKRPSLDSLIGQSSKLPTPVAQTQQGGMRWEGGAGGRKVLKESGLMDVMQGKAMLHTPTAMANMHNPSMEKWPSCQGWGLIANPETLPTPTKRDKRMDAWSPAYDKRKSPTMEAVMDGALTDRASDKWQYARQIAAILTAHGLSGASMTLPLVYGWMMGFPPGWLERALLSAVQGERLRLPSSSKRMATPSSRKSRKRSDGQSSE